MKIFKKLNTRGTGHLELFTAVLVIGLVVAIGGYVYAHTRSHADSNNFTVLASSGSGSSEIYIQACQTEVNTIVGGVYKVTIYYYKPASWTGSYGDIVYNGSSTTVRTTNSGTAYLYNVVGGLTPNASAVVKDHLSVWENTNNGNISNTNVNPSTIVACTSAPVSTTPISGQAVPIGDQPGWHQVFYDDFTDENVPLGGYSGCVSKASDPPNGVCSGLPTTCTTSNGVCPSLPDTAPRSKWWDYPDGWPDTAGDCQYMPSQTMSISGGIMNMFIHTSNGVCMTAVPSPILPNRAAGSVGGTTGPADGQTYGMYSVRMRTDSVPGYLVAFLLWPDSENQPLNGEVDFPNTGLDSNDVFAFLHYEGDNGNGAQASFNLPNTSMANWHTYTIQWTPTYMNFLIDGKSIGDYDANDSGYSQAKIPDTPMHWEFQTESTLGASTPADPVPPSASASGNLQIAWASIWSYDPSAQ